MNLTNRYKHMPISFKHLFIKAFHLLEIVNKFVSDFFLFLIVVPDIWDYDEEEEEIRDELIHDFEQMKRFYKQVLEANSHVLVSIC